MIVAKFCGLDETKLKELGKTLAKHLKGRETLVLTGELGSGKTTFVKGMVGGTGLSEDAVRSPTFTLMNVYVGRITIYHLDLYRLERPDFLLFDVENLIEEDEGVIVVEWGDLYEDFWPEDSIRVRIEVESEDRRTVKLEIPEEVSYLVEAIREFEEKVQSS